MKTSMGNSCTCCFCGLSRGAGGGHRVSRVSGWEGWDAEQSEDKLCPSVTIGNPEKTFRK